MCLVVERPSPSRIASVTGLGDPQLIYEVGISSSIRRGPKPTHPPISHSWTICRAAGPAIFYVDRQTAPDQPPAACIVENHRSLSEQVVALVGIVTLARSLIQETICGVLLVS